MGERTLILLRHAKSDWSVEAADIDRPLAGRGRRQAPDAGRWLAAHIAGIDLAVVSPARRARQTWQLVEAELGASPPTRTDDRLYDASADQLVTVVHDLPVDVETALLVGHNPGFEELASLLLGRWTRLTTSALVVMSLPGPWSDAAPDLATLRASGRPPAG